MFLFFLTATEQTHADRVTLTCSVLTYWNPHTLRWLYDGAHLDGSTKDVQISSSPPCSSTHSCSTTATTSTEKFKEQLKCEVTDYYTAAVQVFSFTHQASGQKTGQIMMRLYHLLLYANKKQFIFRICFFISHLIVLCLFLLFV